MIQEDKRSRVRSSTEHWGGVHMSNLARLPQISAEKQGDIHGTGDRDCCRRNRVPGNESVTTRAILFHLQQGAVLIGSTLPVVAVVICW